MKSVQFSDLNDCFSCFFAVYIFILFLADCDLQRSAYETDRLRGSSCSPSLLLSQEILDTSALWVGEGG